MSNKGGNLQTRRKIQNNSNYSLNNNSINYINNQNTINRSRRKEMVTERSHNKDYKYKKMINNNLENNNFISLNDLIINKQKMMKDANNKSIDLQTYDFIKKNNDEKDYKTKYNNSSKMSINKSMDSKRLLYKNNASNNNSNIIHVNNGKIINLSNLNNFSYATDKYNCYYENKRTTPNLNQNKEKTIITNQTNNLKINLNNYTSKKINEKNNTNNLNKNKYQNQYQKEYQKENQNQYQNQNQNQNQNQKEYQKEYQKQNQNQKKENNNKNPMLFTKKYPKKENNKYPLRINYTNENLSNALETESLLEYTEDKNKDTEKEYSSRRDSKNISKNNLYNSYNNDDKIKNKIMHDNNNNFNKKQKNNNENSNKNKKILNTERISVNDIRNKSLNKFNKNNEQENPDNYLNEEIDDINKINLLFEGNKTDKREIKISNNIPRKYNLTTNHDSLTFKSTKNERKNINNFTIKNNDRLMIINTGNHNKINSMGANDITEPKKERTYKISSHVVNEQFYRDNFSEKEVSSSDDDNFLRMSMQSLNDSKIMEIANRYITDEENLDKNEIIEILNSKKDKL